MFNDGLQQLVLLVNHCTWKCDDQKDAVRTVLDFALVVPSQVATAVRRAHLVLGRNDNEHPDGDLYLLIVQCVLQQ